MSRKWSRFAARPSVIVTLVFLTIVVVSSISSRSFPPAQRAQADASHVVSLYVDGQDRVLTTTDTTVGQVLDHQNITLATGDLVEPSASTSLTQGNYNINVYRARPVTVIDGDQTYHIMSAYQSPELLAQAAGLTVYPEDGYTEQTITDFVGDGSVGDEVTVLRSIPFTVRVDGQVRSLRTRATTVGSALTGGGITLGPKDEVSVPLDRPIVSGADIVITRINDVTTTMTETLPFTTQTVYDDTLAAGQQQVKRSGVDGHRTVTYHIVYNNGQEVSRTTLSVADVVQPLKELLVLGTKVVTSNQAALLGQQLAAARGWSNDQWDSLYQLWMHESGWNVGDVNPSSGACGIPQANPCSKMGHLDAAGQIDWGLDYISVRYGTPDAAWAYWQSHGSY